MRSAVKIALYVNEEQKAILDGQSKIANWLYNTLLERALAPTVAHFQKVTGSYWDGLFVTKVTGTSATPGDE